VPGENDRQRPVRSPREEAVSIARRLRERGFEAFFAGGCVRDRLLGLEPQEFDIATSATPEQVREVFPRALGVGESFGVMLLRSGGFAFEIATFREDGTYRDGRHPDAVRFAGAREDASRRDFTINGLFEDPDDGSILDFVGGEADLRAGVLRAIGDPAARLEEDRLRALRAVRFAARFDLEVDPGTAGAIVALQGDLMGISRERLGQELRKLLAHRSRVRAVELLEAWGLDEVLVGAASAAAPRRHPRLRGLGEDAAAMTALVAWWLDRGGDGAAAAPIAIGLQTRLGLSNREADLIEAVLDQCRAIERSWEELSVAQRRRRAGAPAFREAMAVLAGVAPVQVDAVFAEVAGLSEAGGVCPQRLVTGATLLRLGMRPGPGFGLLLEAVYDAQLEGRIASEEEGVALAKRLAAEVGGGE
jgi:poly(A) polymerase